MNQMRPINTRGTRVMKFSEGGLRGPHRSLTGLAPRAWRGLVPSVRAYSPKPPATLVLSHIFGDQPISSSTRAASIIYLGLDVRKDSVTIAVLHADATAPTCIDPFPGAPSLNKDC